jgi:hypothetical protein
MSKAANRELFRRRYQILFSAKVTEHHSAEPGLRNAFGQHK